MVHHVYNFYIIKIQNYKKKKKKFKFKTFNDEQ
jgi:hypothetical protein